MDTRLEVMEEKGHSGSWGRWLCFPQLLQGTPALAERMLEEAP